ncbi:hypothetical protein HAP94_13560 [Acidithiobacillus ferrivorans]|nr:hypothetical protein [Acidithiobacillus ferrivorans]
MMYFTEKKGQRLAVFDHLISAETGQQIEFPVSSPEQEASMRGAEELGRRGLEGVLDPRDPETSLLLKNSTTG